MKHRDTKFFNLKDMILAAIIIGLLIFTYIKPEDSDAPGAVIPPENLEKKAAPEPLSDSEILELPIPAE